MPFHARNFILFPSRTSHKVGFVQAKGLLGSLCSFIQEVLDVKQKLHQIETEMSRLRSRQMEMEKDGKPNLLLNFGKAIPENAAIFMSS